MQQHQHLQDLPKLKQQGSQTHHQQDLLLSKMRMLLRRAGKVVRNKWRVKTAHIICLEHASLEFQES